MTTLDRDAFEQILGKKLEQAVYACGGTIADLAKLLDVTPSKAGRKLEGETMFLKPSEVFDICRFAGVDIARMMNETWDEVLDKKI